MIRTESVEFVLCDFEDTVRLKLYLVAAVTDGAVKEQDEPETVRDSFGPEVWFQL